jgi:TonB-linked SusC/RagA family outer membrane protein
MERMTAKISIDQSFGKHFRIGLNSLNTWYISRGEDVNPMSDALRLSPILSPYEADGSIRQKVHPNDLMSNPLMDLRPDAIQDDRKRLSTFTTGYFEVDFTGGFKYKLNAGIQIAPMTLQRYYQEGTSKRRSSSSYGTNTSNNRLDWTLEHLLTWDKQCGKHNINVTGMFSAEETSTQEFGLNYDNVLTNQIGYYAPALAQNHKGTGSFSKRDILSVMGRVNYVYDDRYLVTLTARRDAASPLSTGNKEIWSPSAALAWNIFNERFMDGTKNVLSQLKLRLSYGQVANMNLSPYITMGEMSSNKYIFGTQGVMGYYPTEAPNYALGPESTRTFNAGLDFGFLSSRITGSVDIYQQKTHGLMLNYSPPATSGVSESIPYNIGATENFGFELSARAHIFQGNGRDRFKWTSDFNLFLNRNKVTALTEGVSELINENLFVGHPIGSFYEYRSLGLWQNTPEDIALAESFGLVTSGTNSVIGRIKIADISGADGVPDGFLNSLDREIVGSHQANFEGGWTNTFEWKGFDLSVVMYFRQGGLFRSDLYQGGMNSLMGGYYNNIRVDYYTPDNTGARWPAPNNNLQTIDYKGTLTLFDASYVKLRSMTLGYSLPEKMLSRVGIGELRVYASATNPFTFFSEYVNKYHGLDPETNRTVGAVVPPSWQMLFGLNITF